jgi:hypothetical protein
MGSVEETKEEEANKEDMVLAFWRRSKEEERCSLLWVG